MSASIMTVSLRYEEDVVVARQRARQLSGLLGFESQDSARIATAVSEIARNAFRYAKGGEVMFSVEGERIPQVLCVQVKDKGPGIGNLNEILEGRYRSDTGMGLGIIGAQRLMDLCEVDTRPGAGTAVRLKKLLPRRAPLVDQAALSRLTADLAARQPVNAVEEVQQQSRDLMRTLDELRERQRELLRLNRELEDTNRGVVALYAELDEKADHLRRADEMKSRFLSNMSHEFRTPLHSIRALTRMLSERSDGPLNPEQAKQVEFIRVAASGLSELVDDLLDLAKIEAGKVEVKPVEFTLENLFSALRGMLRPLLVGDRVRLVIEEPVDIPPLYTDEQKVSQILRNFISNGIKFTKGGEVRVTACLSDDGKDVVLKVSDTGIGIAPENQQFVFEEFSQVSGVAQIGIKGTGLGLPLCRKLATLLGGTIRLDSEVGIGSTFTAVIPAVYAVEEGTSAVSMPRVAGDKTKVPILIVEDDLQTQMYYATLLRDSPFELLAASNLRQAREVLRALRPAAIVLDIQLDGEDTWGWLGELKNDVATKLIPVLVVTAADDMSKGLALGASGYLEKPVARHDLVRHLDALTAGRVLVIDDDEMIRYTMRKLLQTQPYFMVEAENAKDGLRAAQELHPRAILLDLNLPDMSGQEVLRVLKESKATSRIPVVVVTSQDLSPLERQELTQSAQAILFKQDLHGESLHAVLESIGLEPA